MAQRSVSRLAKHINPQSLKGVYHDGRGAFGALMQEQYLQERRGVGQFLADSFDMLSDTFMSLFQSRKTRAGKTVELAFAGFLRALGIPFEEQQVVQGRPDFVIPDIATYLSAPARATIIASKRTLRERWRQIIPEAPAQGRFWLLTIDETLSRSALRDMRDARVYVVVPERIRQQHYPDVENVVPMDDFITALGEIGISPQQPPPSAVARDDP